ncbi:MAG: malate/lactate/ureidoglycolate dehydrogenase [Hylemonella sp.]
MSEKNAKLISAAELRAHVARIVRATGSQEQEAQRVAHNLVMANLSGHDSHGVGMLPRYVDAVLEGGLIPNNGVRVMLDAGAMLALDGQRGYGQTTGEQAMQMGIERALAHGSCVMTLGNSHHLGRIGHWAEMAVAKGLVSIHFVNVLSRPVVAPWGGADGRFGTNPVCIGVPLKAHEPFILDFATSRVAQGKMRVAYNEGRKVDLGYLIDPSGNPTTDPGVVVVPQAPSASGNLFGALMTFGEHKGYGLAVACEFLAGALSGGGTWHREGDARRSVHNSMLCVLIDPVKLGTQAAFEREAQAFVDWLNQGPVAPGHESVMIAGDPERKARAAREQSGIRIDSATWAEIESSAAKLNCQL